MDKAIDQSIINFLFESNADACAVGIIDFRNNQFESIKYKKEDQCISLYDEKIFFDLASLTKVLVNSLSSLLEANRLDDEDRLVLNHRAGLPSWGLLSKNNWKDHINSFPINESNVLYSDFSALRFMLNCAGKYDLDLYQLASKLWDADLKSWLDLDELDTTLQNGYVKQRANFRMVHDPNAQNIYEKLSHAGLFGTVESVCKTLLNANNEKDLLRKMQNSISDNSPRFVDGWDRAEDLDKTLAGRGCSNRTFGHLGFTGTSIWIDSKKALGHVILTNCTKHYWYDKQGLNNLRRQVGQLLWGQK